MPGPSPLLLSRRAYPRTRGGGPVVVATTRHELVIALLGHEQLEVATSRVQRSITRLVEAFFEASSLSTAVISLLGFVEKPVDRTLEGDRASDV